MHALYGPKARTIVQQSTSWEDALLLREQQKTEKLLQRTRLPKDDCTPQSLRETNVTTVPDSKPTELTAGVAFTPSIRQPPGLKTTESTETDAKETALANAEAHTNEPADASTKVDAKTHVKAEATAPKKPNVTFKLDSVNEATAHVMGSPSSPVLPGPPHAGSTVAHGAGLYRCLCMCLHTFPYTCLSTWLRTCLYTCQYTQVSIRMSIHKYRH